MHTPMDWRGWVTSALALVLAFGAAAVAAQQQVRIKKVAGNNGFFLFLKTDGSVWGLGQCDKGQLWPLGAPGTCKEIRKPRVLDLPGKAIDVAAGPYAAFVLLDKGTVISWGWDTEGQLGTGPRFELGRARPRYREPTVIPGLSDVVQIEAAIHSAAALTADGTVYWWGERPLEVPNKDLYSATPVRVDGMPPASAIALSSTHLLAIGREDRAVYAIGTNKRGQLGLGTTASISQAQRVPTLPPAASICAAHELSAAVLADGTVRVWGGKIGGDGPGTTVAIDGPEHGIHVTPAVAAGIAGAERVTCEAGVVGVLMKDRTLRLWGHDGWGQIGVGRALSEYQPKPRKPALADVADLFVLGSRSFAVTTDGRLFFWGVGDTSYDEPMKTMKQRPALMPF